MTQFPYITENGLPSGLMARLPMTLALGDHTLEIVGLLDSGAAVNVLPYRVGLALGAVWEALTTEVTLVGSLGQFDARALVVTASNSQINLTSAVKLVFAWTMAENAPIIFGQMNFFLEFDVCFYRSQSMFEVKQKRI